MPSASPPPPAPPPPPALVSEALPCYKYPLACKRTLNPTLTHQFKVVWPWPTRRQSTVSTSATATVKREETDAEAKHAGAAASTPAAPSLWRDRRRYGRPSLILDFSSDPFMAACETRRAAMLLSPGYRFFLPLTSLDPPEELIDGAGRAYWKPHYRSPPPTCNAAAASPCTPVAFPHDVPPPYCAELVIGEVAALEKATQRRVEPTPRAHSAQSRGPIYHKPTFFSKINVLCQPALEEAVASTNGDPGEADEEDEEGEDAEPNQQQQQGVKSKVSSSSSSSRCLPARKEVLTHFFYTIPFRVRWLTQLKGHIVASLPCEERLVTLHAPHSSPPAAAAAPAAAGVRAAHRSSAHESQQSAITNVKSFTFPRGVVPLEVAEIMDRPFLAVGTYEHGVLLCGLDTAAGAVESIVRVISVRGGGGALFPVTRLAALFPPLSAPQERLKRSSGRSAKATAPPPRSPSSSSSPPWAHRAAAMASLRDGALLCSSPYDDTSTLVKLHGAADGVVEDMAVMRRVDTMLDVSPAMLPDRSPLVCTKNRKLHCVHCLPDGEEEMAAAAQHHHYHRHGLSDRTSPLIFCEKLASADFAFTRLSSSPPLLQAGLNNYVSNRQYTRQWLLAVDSRNCLVLLDRIKKRFQLHSAFQLRCAAAATGESGNTEGDSEGVSSAAALRTPPAGSVLTERTATAGRDRGTAEKETDEEKAAASAKVEGEDGVTFKKEPVEDAEPDSGDVPLIHAFLAPPTAAERKRARPATASTPAKTRREVKRERENESGSDEGSELGESGAQPFAATFVALEDTCTGVVMTSARDELIQVAAAHDGHYVSLVTWRVGHATAPAPASSLTRSTLKKEEVVE